MEQAMRTYELAARATVEARSVQEAAALFYGTFPINVPSQVDEDRYAEVTVDADAVPVAQEVPGA